VEPPAVDERQATKRGVGHAVENQSRRLR
jgi:hypothetical protein